MKNENSEQTAKFYDIMTDSFIDVWSHHIHMALWTKNTKNLNEALDYTHKTLLNDANISKKDLENLAALARLRIDAKNEKKLIQDLEKILGHFNELKNVDTQNVEPMTGGTAFTNIFREDDAIGGGLDKTSALEQFPEKKDGFLKIPPVFSDKGGFVLDEE